MAVATLSLSVVLVVGVGNCPESGCSGGWSGTDGDSTEGAMTLRGTLNAELRCLEVAERPS